MAAELAQILGIPCFHLDAIAWQPNWVKLGTEEFRAKVRKALEDSPNGWVVDGNYTGRLGNLVQDQATDVLCKHYKSTVDRDLVSCIPLVCRK